MSVAYKPVLWNRNKYIYDAMLVAMVAVYLAIFHNLAPAAGATPLDDASRDMRAFGSCAFLMLTALLCIGPLARFDARFLPILYNRRHFGVLTCAVALAHAYAVMGWYFAYSPADPFVALLSSNTSVARLAGFPFEMLGIIALLVLLVMAATSHDFWLSFLTPPVWKAMHMLVYPAYAAIVAHVALGALQGKGQAALTGIVVGGATLVCLMHLAAAWLPAPAAADAEANMVKAGRADAVPEGRAITVALADGSRVAIFRHKGRLSAVTNVCAHQNGPLGEGRVVNGCITCPWHGYQYQLADGCAPAPFTEKIATYNLAVRNGDILLDPRPNPPGTRVEPVAIDGAAA